jgi:hypothetical protein
MACEEPEMEVPAYDSAETVMPQYAPASVVEGDSVGVYVMLPEYLDESVPPSVSSPFAALEPEPEIGAK